MNRTLLKLDHRFRVTAVASALVMTWVALGCSGSGDTSSPGTSPPGTDASQGGAGAGGSTSPSDSGDVADTGKLDGAAGTGGGAGTGGNPDAGDADASVDDADANAGGSGGSADAGDADASVDDADANAGGSGGNPDAGDADTGAGDSDSAPPDCLAIQSGPGCDPTCSEACNGKDDNCNGTNDEGDPGGGDVCQVPGAKGACAVGLNHCQGGAIECVQQVQPTLEVCDGIDNDCNDTVDDASEVDGKACATSLPGECATGLTHCAAGILSCSPLVAPGSVTEACNSKDDDCNGTTDDVIAIGAECSGLNPAAANVQTWVCANGACQLHACAGAFEDCDGVLANGCEANLATDPAHCGSCSPCNLPHAVAACNSGTCSVASCQGTWANCDGIAASGCEADTSIDPSNCNGCGNICASGLCGSQIAALMSQAPSGWSFNGSAHWFAGDSTNPASAILTDNATNLAGTVFYNHSLPADDMVATFDFRVRDGGGGDGLAFAMIENGATALGGGGSGFGVVGLTGYGVEFDEYNNMACDDASTADIGIVSLAPCNANPGMPSALATNPFLPFNLLNGGWHTCSVTLSAGKMLVACDGQWIVAPVSLPAFTPGKSYHYGFGGGTGVVSSTHEVRNVTIQFGSPRCFN